MGRSSPRSSEAAPRVVFYRFRWLWDFGFWAFTGPAPARALAQRLLTRFGAPGLLRLDRRGRAPTSSSRSSRRRHRGARPLAPLRAARRARSSPAITDVAAMRLLGEPRRRRPPRHPARVDRRGAPDRRRRRRRAHRDGFTIPASTRRVRRPTRGARSACRGRTDRRSSRAAAGASATSQGAVEEALAFDEVRGRLPDRPKRGAARGARAPVRRRAARRSRRVHRGDGASGSPPPTRSCTRPAG